MCVALEALPGVAVAFYNAEADLFLVRYDPAAVDIPAMFAAVFQAGKKMGQEYLPGLMPQA